MKTNYIYKFLKKKQQNKNYVLNKKYVIFFINNLKVIVHYKDYYNSY